MSVSKRVTANLKDDDLARLDEIVAATGLNRNDAVRKAIATEAYMSRVRAEGRKVLTEDKQGKLREIVWLS